MEEYRKHFTCVTPSSGQEQLETGGDPPTRTSSHGGKESRRTPQASALCMFAAFATEVTHGLDKG